MKTPTLETTRLRLRAVRDDDVDEIFACWMNDEAVSRYMFWDATDNIEDTRERTPHRNG